jgi:hypothetical protein
VGQTDVKIHGTPLALDCVINETAPSGNRRQVLRMLVIAQSVADNQAEGLQFTQRRES